MPAAICSITRGLEAGSAVDSAYPSNYCHVDGQVKVWASDGPEDQVDRLPARTCRAGGPRVAFPVLFWQQAHGEAICAILYEWANSS